jgi:hypothetical protein
VVLIDWKSYYRSEMEAPEAREILAGLFKRVETDETIDRVLAGGAILSFPHTALSYAAPLQARVVAGLAHAGVQRVIALGVFHASTLPSAVEKDRGLLSDDSASPEARRGAFARLSGGFMPPDRVATTPFGDVPLVRAEEEEGVRVDREGLLAHEFSLDSFLSLLAFHAAETGRRPPAVLPLFVGPTRDPVSGGFETADRLAEALAGWRAPGTAIVTTGDLVHYGTAYGPPERMTGKPTDPAELETFFARETTDALDLAFVAGDRAAAYERAATVLQNDQRHILPVLIRLLGPGADYRVLAFSLSDYAGILEVAAPCVVASALVAFVPAASG